MLELPLACDLPQRIEDFGPDRFAGHRIATGLYCHGRTAGAGSSRVGAVVRP